MLWVAMTSRKMVSEIYNYYQICLSYILTFQIYKEYHDRVVFNFGEGKFCIGVGAGKNQSGALVADLNPIPDLNPVTDLIQSSKPISR